MPIKDATWFSNLYRWRERGGEPRPDDTDRAIRAAEKAEHQDEPVPAARRAWRALLGQTNSHPDPGNH